MRKLTEREQILNKKIIRNEKIIIKSLDEDIKYSMKMQHHQEEVWRHEDSVRDYTRKQKRKQFELLEKELQAKLTIANNSVKEWKRQIVEGVEVVKKSG